MIDVKQQPDDAYRYFDFFFRSALLRVNPRLIYLRNLCNLRMN